MSFLTKWGFSRQERPAISVLIAALLIGLAASYFRQRIRTAELETITPADSAIVLQFKELADNIHRSENDSISPSEALSGNVFPIDINAASASGLQKLPGIGPVIAERIIEYRSINGPFESLDSLINVRGIGPAKLKAILDGPPQGGFNAAIYHD